MDYRQLLRIMLQDTKQEDLALELSTTQATISRWLSGQEPRGSALERIRSLARARRLAADATIENTQNDLETNHHPTRRTSSQNNNGRHADSSKHIVDIANLSVSDRPLDREMTYNGTHSESYETETADNPNNDSGFWSFPDQVNSGWKNMDKTYAMTVTGDSMEPTLASGSYVFVDTTHRYPSPPDLYAVDYGHGLMVKRVELLPEDKIRIISDNGRYSDFEFHQQEVEVFGRVVASFQWRGS